MPQLIKKNPRPHFAIILSIHNISITKSLSLVYLLNNGLFSSGYSFCRPVVTINLSAAMEELHLQPLQGKTFHQSVLERQKRNFDQHLRKPTIFCSITIQINERDTSNRLNGFFGVSTSPSFQRDFFFRSCFQAS